MALRAFLVLLSFAGAVGEDVAGALASDDTCAAGQDCSLELHQLRGMKVNYLEALEDASDDEEDEEEAVYVEEEAEVEGGGCTNPKDMKVWKKGGKKTFDASLNHCGRSCAAGFPCTKDRQPRRLCGIQVFRWCSVSAAAGSWDSGTEVSSCCFAFFGLPVRAGLHAEEGLLEQLRVLHGPVGGLLEGPLHESVHLGF
ncbi:unnamed protein product [Symbiodinium natans]|uniref:Uncharacterized protein n=1 Tax=Symbiodinium natans TaxID=878477 RepID=A0A812NPP1_9DINO|nr:unnamed protein product [Symbiodinium natans]